MKAKIIILIAFVITFAAKAQQQTITEDQVPKAVQRSLTIKYPDAIVKKWCKENDTYTVKCKQKNKQYDATFSTDGKWMNTATIVELKKVPDAVRDACYKSVVIKWKMDKITQVDYSDGTTIYVMEMDNGDKYDSDPFKEIRQVYISPEGQVIKTHKK